MDKKSPAASFPRPHGNIQIEKKKIHAGMHLFRIHSALYGGTQFNDTANGDARFSPIKDRTTQEIIPTLYAGDSTEVAICEVVFHDVDISQTDIVFSQASLKNKQHTEIELTMPLRVAVIDQLSVIKMRAGKKLIHCDADHYPLTREWAEHIHEQHPDIQGLEWPSRQHAGKAWLFFGDRIPNAGLNIVTTHAIIHDARTKEKILKLARLMNIVIE